MPSKTDPVKRKVTQYKPCPVTMYCCTSLAGSSLQGMVRFVALPSLVHHYRVWYVLLHFPRWFIITGYGTFCCTSLTDSSLLGMVRFVAFPSLVLHYWVWNVLLHFPHWFIITGYGTCCCTSQHEIQQYKPCPVRKNM
jgi:hypothetical protein